MSSPSVTPAARALAISAALAASACGAGSAPTDAASSGRGLDDPAATGADPPSAAPAAPPRYDDGLRNGAETDVDCGGDPAHPCAERKRCAIDADCATAICGAVEGQPDKECLVTRSCAGGSGAYFSCGPAASESCCRSHEVPGGAFHRFNNAAYPAKVSRFRLDAYEITVGRFRRYVAATGGDLRAHAPAAGAGAHPKVKGSGWRAEWNAMLPASATEVDLMFDACSAGGNPSDYGARTYWSPAVDAAVKGLSSDPDVLAANTKEALDGKPLNCTPWFVLYAFCVWDGGRLPTVAEWLFAAQGGAEQRPFAWGSVAPADAAPWNGLSQYYAPLPTFPAAKDYGALRLWNPAAGANAWPVPYQHTWGTPYRVNGDNAAHIMPVGKKPLGNGRWGHADLAGNLHEWTLDEGGPATPATCDDCANVDYPALDHLDPTWPIAGWDPEWYRGGRRALLGGSWENSSHAALTYSDYFLKEALKYPVRRTYAELGARCARDVP